MHSFIGSADFSRTHYVTKALGLDIGDAPVKKTKNLTLGSTNLVMETGRLTTC